MLNTGEIFIGGNYMYCGCPVTVDDASDCRVHLSRIDSPGIEVTVFRFAFRADATILPEECPLLSEFLERIKQTG